MHDIIQELKAQVSTIKKYNQSNTKCIEFQISVIIAMSKINTIHKTYI